MCSQSHPLFSPHLNTNDISLEEFKSILTRFPKTENVTLQGVGEPLLNPDIFGMIEHAHRAKKKVSLTTNGSLLTEENSKRILESGLNRIMISIDATTKDLYESIRPGGDFDLLLKNTKRLVELNGQKKKPMHIVCQTVMLNENLEEIPKFPDLLRKLGIKNVFFSEIVVPPMEPVTSKPAHNIVKGLLDDLKKKTRNSGLSVFTLADFRPRKVPCFWLWGGVYITAEGLFSPCCMQPFPQLLSLGNVFKDDFNKTWNSDIYKNARNAMKKRPLEPCRLVDCPFLAMWEDERKRK